MAASAIPNRADGKRFFGAPVPALHVITLCGFALAQPLYDLLGRNPEFFIAHQAQPIDLLLLTALVSLVIPTALLLGLRILLPHPWRGPAHHILLGCLFSLVATQVLNRLAALPSVATVCLAMIAGLAGILAYARFRPVQLFLTVLSPSALLFPVLFLADSDASRLVWPEKVATDAGVGNHAAIPVVLVVFDEFPLVSLLDGQRLIDAERYPNFARLAGRATWFRNATSVHYKTTAAVPAILTGCYPANARADNTLPTWADHPRNLFTLLQESHEFHVFESVTRLCPDRLAALSAESEGLGKRLGSLLTDTALVEMHLLAPRNWRNRLPPVNQGWNGFAGCGCCSARLADDRPALWARFLETITPSEQPALHFIHVILPHSPFRFLPSGKRYATDTGLEALSAEGTWPNDPAAVRMAQQRHLLQVAFVDQLLGQLLSRLQQAGLDDRALVIVTADHGISFVPGQPYRHATPWTRADILRVPLFIKRPGQQAGEISDRNVQTIDVLPTVADLLGSRASWPMDGQSVFDLQLPEPREKIFLDQDQRLVVSRDLDGDFGCIAQKIEEFGVGSLNGIFVSGRDGALVGQAVRDLDWREAPGLSVRLDDADLLAHVDLGASYLPTCLRGEVSLDRNWSEPITLAVAVNGVVRATCQTEAPANRKARWSVLLPERALRSGRNDIEVFGLARKDSGEPRLERAVLQSGRRATAHIPAGQGLCGPDGQPLRITPRCLAGCLDQVRLVDGCVEFAGWSADVTRQALPESILIYVNDRLFYAGTANTPRADVAESMGIPALERAGFTFALPLEWFDRTSNPQVRIFALSRDGEACELSYPRWYRDGGLRPLATSH